MADNSSIQRAEIEGLSEDDPFAELTRIMGHEPRNDAAQTSEPNEDLALELENELLADLADVSESSDEEAASQQDDTWQEPQPDWRTDRPAEQDAAPDEAAEASALEDELDASFASAFEGEFQGDEAAGEPFPEQEESFAPNEPASADAYHDEDPAQPDVAEPELPQEFEARETDWVPNDWAPLDSDFGALEAEVKLAQEPTTPDADELADQDDASGEEFHASHADLPARDPAQDDEQPDSHDEAAQSAYSERLSTEKHYLSPQDFAQSVAQGRNRTAETVDDQPEAEAYSPEPVEVEEPDDVTADETTPSEAVEYAPWETPEFTSFEPATDDGPAGTEFAAAEPEVEETPYIDTVDVPEGGVTVDDARHIPEFKAEPDPAPAARFDDLESVLARAFGDPDDSQQAQSYTGDGHEQQHSARNDDSFEQTPAAPAAEESVDEADDDFGFEAAFASGMAAGHTLPQETAPAGTGSAHADFGTDLEADLQQDHALWDEPRQEVPPVAPARPQFRDRKRGLLVAAAVGGVAVLGALGAFALTSGGDDAAAPVLVRADAEPMKVKPENPGGQEVPNQDSQVYQRVAGDEANAQPAQERLVSTAEEPAEVTPPPARQDSAAGEGEETAAAGEGEETTAKSEERLESDADTAASTMGSEVASVSPRRVRTMIVRPDGTIVPRPTSESTEAAQETAAQTVTSATSAMQEITTGAGQVAAPLGGVQQPLGAGQPAAGAERQSGATSVSDAAPIPQSRPAAAPQQQQAARPQNTQPPTEPQQTAAVAPQQTAPAAVAPAPAAVTAPTGDWSVQISSQPTVESAQQSYRDIAQRHGDLLAGKGVNIVKADIEGKGTYYRVRIPSASKDTAIQLCSQLKSAGASCFVSK